MIKQEFDYKINGNSYNVILYLKSKKQRNIYYRFKENHFEISAPLSVKIEDIYKGLNQYGKGLIKKLAQIAVERGCGRLEWWCLDWNKPSIDFYLSLGAEPMDDWTVYRISGDVLQNLGKD